MLAIIHLPLEAIRYQYPEAYGIWLARCDMWGLPSPLPRYGDVWIEDETIREIYECNGNCRHCSKAKK